MCGWFGGWIRVGGVPLFLSNRTFIIYIPSVYMPFAMKKKRSIGTLISVHPVHLYEKKIWDEKIKQMKNTVIVPENCTFGRKWNIYHSPSPTKKDTRNTY